MSSGGGDGWVSFPGVASLAICGVLSFFSKSKHAKAQQLEKAQQVEKLSGKLA